MGAAAASADEEAAGLYRRQQRPAEQGLEAMLVYDRATASRMGITPQSIDNTLYQAFGQAPVSTMYTPAQPILRGDGSRAAILAKPGRD